MGHKRLVTYVLRIEQNRTGRTVVAREILRYKRGKLRCAISIPGFFPWGRGYAITNEEDFSKPDEALNREEQELDAPDILSIKGLGQFERFKAASAFRLMIENWHISDFHVSEARPSQEEGFAEHLSTRGDNLPLVASYLYENHKECFDRVLPAMQRRVPGVSVVEAKPTEDGRLVLRFQDGSFKDPFIARYVSDGTIKMFAYLVLLNDPKPYPLLAVEEPKISYIPNYSRSWRRSFENTLSAVGKFSYPPILLIFSMLCRWRKFIVSARSTDSPRSQGRTTPKI